MSWKKYNLGELVESVSIRAKDIVHENRLKFLGVSNEEGITDSKYAAEEKAEEYKIIEKGCFAYNPYRINVGSIALMKDEEKGLISPAYVVFKPKPNSIIPELLLSFLKSKEGLRQIKLNARGTVRQALRFEDLCKIQISLPSYEEQKILFDRLTSFNKQGKAQIDENNHQLDLIKNLRQQILQDAMQGKLVQQDPNDEPASKLLERIKAEKEQLIKEGKLKKEKPLPPIKLEEIPFEIPENWVWCRLGEIAKQITDGDHQTPPRISEGRKLLSAKNIRNGFFDFTNVDYISEEHFQKSITRCRPQKEDVLIVSVGATIGRSAILNVDEEFAIVRSVALIKPLKIYSNKYIKILLDSPLLQKDISERAWGTAQPCLYLNQINELSIPLPPVQEQFSIVSKIDQLMQLCDELEQTVQQNQKYTQDLLQVALKEALEMKL